MSSVPSDSMLLSTMPVGGGMGSASAHGLSGTTTKPRRLSASSQHRRRLSDFSRYTGKTPALMATVNHGRATVAPSASIGLGASDDHEDDEDDEDEDDVADMMSINLSPSSAFRNPDLYGGSGGISGRRKGVIFKCESCSKVYRHPSCLIKHRWEHSPHWANTAKVPLSKHQQVQLLEGAAILSHLGIAASLPEDRAVWPSWTSGGTLPMPTGTRDPAAALVHNEGEGGSMFGEEDESSMAMVPGSDEEDESAVLEQDEDELQSAAGVEQLQSGLGLRRSLRPRSRSAGALLAMAHPTRRISGGITKTAPARALEVGGGSMGGVGKKKTGPVKAGFQPPAHARVTQVAPGVLLAPSPPPPSSFREVRASAPIAISIPSHYAHAATSPYAQSGSLLSPTSVSARSPLSASFGTTGLEVLASLSLGGIGSPSGVPTPLPIATAATTSASYSGMPSSLSMFSRSVTSSTPAFSFGSSLPQSSVRSSSGDSDELPEVDEDDDVEMDPVYGNRKVDQHSTSTTSTSSRSSGTGWTSRWTCEWSVRISDEIFQSVAGARWNLGLFHPRRCLNVYRHAIFTIIIRCCLALLCLPAYPRASFVYSVPHISHP
ncbi:hypothetical protein BKA62DRAFT_37362 [Auriculariales sp. MPI-PUGE-AT-0066]|nr:hypothetical protein BKA62DRAFT_37362 [Auriculariales sp. MPI-PUGE-AT-0066]